MRDKPKQKQDDPEQSKRFIETAKQIGASEKKEDADRAFKRIAAKAPQKAAKKPGA